MGDLPAGLKPLPGIVAVVVDDNDDSRELLTQLLEYCGAVVTAVASAEEAIETLTRVRADVLISDLAMPDTDGYTLIRRVRAMPEDAGGRVPAIAITAFTEDYDSTKAYAAGFNGYVKKPIDITVFCNLVARLVTPPS
jgi:CheY-like chemotaxis protein